MLLKTIHADADTYMSTEGANAVLQLMTSMLQIGPATLDVAGFSELASEYEAWNQSLPSARKHSDAEIARHYVDMFRHLLGEAHFLPLE